MNLFSRSPSLRHACVAALMSLVLPGWGQLRNGQWYKALWLFLGFALTAVPGVSLIALTLPASAMLPALVLGLLLALALWLYGMVDAWRTARQANEWEGLCAASWQRPGVYLLVLLLCDFIALPLLTQYQREHFVEAFRIPSASMEPGILAGDFLFADKRYNCPGCKGRVQRGDVAIFTYPNDRTQLYIKRIIALPGDQVSLINGQIHVNGQLLHAPSQAPASPPVAALLTSPAPSQATPAGASQTVLTVPPGQVYVLGDNRLASTDSRQFGTVPLQDVVGKARQLWFSWGSNGIRWERLGKVLE